MPVVLVLFLALLPGCRWLPWGGGDEKGMASWYGNEYHGRTTASGEVFDQYAMTAAHKKLPFGTIVRVKNKRNGKEVTVRINDRGPFKRGRVIDLSRGAADKIEMIRDGVVPVELDIVRKGRG